MKSLHHRDLIILQLAIILRSLNASSYIVGGYVRDLLLGLPSKDIDIVTDAPYDAMATAFVEAGWNVKQTGKHYLVLNISKQGHHFELSNFRKDTDNNGGKLGTVTTDADRRDFTINALYMSLTDNTILDPTGKGKTDIQNHCLRFIDNPVSRIMEDPLRIYRFYRLLATKSLIPHSASLKAVRRYFKITTKVPSERIRSEIERIIKL